MNENHATKVSFHRLTGLYVEASPNLSLVHDRRGDGTKHEKCTVHKDSMGEFIVFGIGIVIVIRIAIGRRG